MSTPRPHDVFTIPILDGYLLYMPRLGLVLGVDAAVHELVEALKQGRPAEASAFADSWVEALRALGAMDASPIPASPPGPFRPAQVTLSLTSGCELRCVYCYARAGETARELDPRAARSALRLAADNALALGEPKVRVAFHGEGEPTYAWPLFRECVLEAEALADARGLEADFAMSTNAMWGPARRRFILEHFKRLSVSLDGLPEVQDRQRPTAGGNGSFGVVAGNLRAMDEAGMDYGVRATVLPRGVDTVLPFLEFLSAKTRADTLTLEPVFQSGRGTSLSIDREDFYRRFAESFRKVQRRGAELGLDVTYSGCRPGVAVGRFCQATGPDLNFVVMTSGVVSSCYEINDPGSEKGDVVVYGKYDPQGDRFLFDERKLARLREHGVWNIPACRDCFAKWNCGGDCLARGDLTLAPSRPGPGHADSPRCGLNRSLTMEALARYGIAADVLDQIP